MANTESNTGRSPYVDNKLSSDERPLDDPVSQHAADPPPAYNNVGSDPSAVNSVNDPPRVNQIPPQIIQTVIVNQPSFGDMPVSCTCTNCNRNIVTRVENSSGLLVWGVCLLLILLGCWLGCCLIPFCIDDMQDHIHYCPNCRSVLGKKQRL